MTGAILLFVLNLVGLGVGPVYVDWIADRMEPAHGDQALAYGFAGVIPFVVLTVIAHLAASVLHWSRQTVGGRAGVIQP